MEIGPDAREGLVVDADPPRKPIDDLPVHWIRTCWRLSEWILSWPTSPSWSRAWLRTGLVGPN